MSEKHYVEDTKHEKVEFSKAFNRVLNIGILLSGIHFLLFLYFITDLPTQLQLSGNLGRYFTEALYLLSVGLFFVCFIQIKMQKKPFSEFLSSYFIVIGYLWMLLSFIVGHLPGYSGRIEIMSFGYFTLIDGKTASIGIVIIVIGYLMKYGHQYQLNDDETV